MDEEIAEPKLLGRKEVLSETALKKLRQSNRFTVGELREDGFRIITGPSLFDNSMLHFSSGTAPDARLELKVP